MSREAPRHGAYYVRIVTLERLALGVIPLYALFGLVVLIMGLTHGMNIPATLIQFYTSSLEWLCTPIVLALAGSSALSTYWSLGGGVGFGPPYYPSNPPGTMGGTVTQNAPQQPPPAG